MTPDDARRVLGLDTGAPWREVRSRHRALIRSVHPDAGGDAREAAELNRALAVLEAVERATPDAAPTTPTAATPAPSRPADPAAALEGDVNRLLRLDVAPDELLLRFADAGHRIGEVVFVDAVAGLLEVVVGDGRDAAQLAVTVGSDDGAGVRVAFMLEPLAAGACAPPIDTVVDDLVAAVDAGD